MCNLQLLWLFAVGMMTIITNNGGSIKWSHALAYTAFARGYVNLVSWFFVNFDVLNGMGDQSQVDQAMRKEMSEYISMGLQRSASVEPATEAGSSQRLIPLRTIYERNDLRYLTPGVRICSQIISNRLLSLTALRAS